MTLGDAIAAYLRVLTVRGYSQRTVATYGPHLAAFAQWAEVQGVTQCRDVDAPLLRMYQADLSAQTTRHNRLPSRSMQRGRLGVVKGFFAFLVKRQVLLVDPAQGLELPRQLSRSLPRQIPTPAQMARLLAVPDTKSAVGLRDRAVLETLYSSGLRNAEVRGLRVADVDLGAGLVSVYRGKGQKDRVIPLGREACRWIARYLARVRPRWARNRKASTLFLTQRGGPMNFSNLNKLVKNCVRKAKLGLSMSVHTLRHACATHMIKAGAELRHLQRFLGHKSLLSTQIYTHLDLTDLKRVHRKCHPRAKRI